VGRRRFQIGCDRPEYFHLLKDIVIGTFSILEHTPINRLGINRHFYCRYEDVQKRGDFEKQMLSNRPWDNFLSSPELESIKIRGKRTDKHKGSTLLTIEPLTDDPEIVVFSLNDHFDFKENGKDPKYCLEILANNWKDIQNELGKKLETAFKLPG